jgi:hypothetical protein
LDFWHGQAVLRHHDGEETLHARVFLDIDFDLKIETSNCLGIRAIFIGHAGNITCEIPGVAQPIDLFLGHTSKSDTGDETLVFVPKRSPIWKRSVGEVVKGRAALINFSGFNSKLNNSIRIVLDACGWLVSIVPVGGNLLAYPELLQSDEHKITHQLEFERSDHARFSDDDMHHFLEKISLFFSFCHGGWVAIGFAVGFDRGGIVVAEEWGIGRIGPHEEPSGFLDPFHLDGLVELYPLFMEKVCDAGWRDVFSHAVYWLRRANIDNAGPDGGVILLQAVLERFAWHLLVRHNEALSEKGFNDLTAADQMRLMISVLGLPKEVPDGLIDLAKFAKSYGLDAAEAFTRVRNKIVHPPKLRVKEEKLPFYDTYRLGRWYAELAVLAACGYKGEYSNRTRKDQWVGQVEKVPWVL